MFETLDGSWSGNSRSMAKYASKRDGVSYQLNIGNLWSAEELEAIGFRVKAPEPAPPQPSIEEQTATAKEGLINTIKQEAGRRIVAIIPEWKQRNLTAQAAQLAEKGRANWTVEELATWDAGQAIWDQVAAIRATSDALELALDAMTLEQMREFDTTADEHWV